MMTNTVLYLVNKILSISAYSSKSNISFVEIEKNLVDIDKYCVRLCELKIGYYCIFVKLDIFSLYIYEF